LDAWSDGVAEAQRHFLKTYLSRCLLASTDDSAITPVKAQGAVQAISFGPRACCFDAF
jgi:hypothetical protein